MIADFGKFYTDGGFFMHPIMLLGLGTAVIAAVYAASSLRVMLPLLVAGTLATLLMGGNGTAFGIINAIEATATAPEDMKTQMLCASITISLNALRLALAFAIVHVAVGSVGLFIAGLKRGAKTTP